jgi:hypothetical protein
LAVAETFEESTFSKFFNTLITRSDTSFRSKNVCKGEKRMSGSKACKLSLTQMQIEEQVDSSGHVSQYRQANYAEGATLMRLRTPVLCIALARQQN